MDLSKGDIVIFSGEGDEGTWERYNGAREAKALRSRLSRERCSGDRWASAWIEAEGYIDKAWEELGIEHRVYLELDASLESTGKMRALEEKSIKENPAAMLRAGKKNSTSAENGKKGGRPTETDRQIVRDYWAHTMEKSKNNPVLHRPFEVDRKLPAKVVAALEGKTVVQCEQKYLAPADSERAMRGLETGHISQSRYWYLIDGVRVSSLTMQALKEAGIA